MRICLTRETAPWLAVVCGWGLAFSLACRLTAALPAPPRDMGIVGALLGEGRSALSARFYGEADTFFHRGVAHYEKRALSNDWIQTWRADIAPTTHQHTEGGDVAEIVPWLELSTKADPHNVEAALVMAFWVNTGLRKPDLAHRILVDTQRHNPGDYRVFLEMGRLAVQQAQFDKAENWLSASLARWPSPLAADDEQALLDRAEAMTLLGFLHEMKGDLPQAIASFKNTLAIFPQRSYIRDRVECLAAGRTPAESARDRLATLVRRTVDDACAHGEEHHDGDHHDAGPLSPGQANAIREGAHRESD